MKDLTQLVQRAQAGDLDAFGAIARQFQDMAWGYAYSLLGDFHLAEDAAQDAFLNAYLDLGSLESPAAFPGWLRTIVFRRCGRMMRHSRIPQISLDEIPEPSSCTEDPAAGLEGKEARTRVLDAVMGLPEHERIATTLFYLGNCSHRDIGSFLDLTPDTVNNRLRAARGRLKTRLLTMANSELKKRAPSKDDRFTSGLVVTGMHLKSLERVHDDYVKSLMAMLASQLEGDFNSDGMAVAVQSFAEFLDGSDDGSASATFTLGVDTVWGRVLLEMGPEVCRTMDAAGIDLESGVNLRSPGDNPLLDALRQAWRQALPVDPGWVYTLPQLNNVTLTAGRPSAFIDPEARVASVTCVLTIDGSSTTLRLCYPLEMVYTVMHKLARRHANREVLLAMPIEERPWGLYAMIPNMSPVDLAEILEMPLEAVSKRFEGAHRKVGWSHIQFGDSEVDPHPTVLKPVERRAFEQLHIPFNEAAAAAFADTSQLPAESWVSFVDQTTFGEFTDFLSNPCCAYTFRMDTLDAQGIMEISQPLLYGLTGEPDRRSGGISTEERKGWVNALAQRLLESLEEAWRPVFSFRASNIAFENDPESLGIHALTEPTALIVFEIALKDSRNGLLSIAYPIKAIAPAIRPYAQSLYGNP